LRGPTSIGVRWAIRNAGIFAVVLLGIAAFAHFEVKRRVTDDAKLLLELEVRELVEELGIGALTVGQIAAEVDIDVRAEPDPDLQLGVQVFSDSGERLYGRGALAALGFEIPEELIRSEGSASVFNTILIPDGDPYWVVSAKGAVGYVQVGVSSREFVDSASELRRILASAAPVLALVVGGIGWWIANQSLRPIREMVGAARGIGFSRLSARVPTSGNGDELDLLASTLNDAFARVEEGADKLRRFTADAAHELRTPLTRLRSRLEATVADPEVSRETLRQEIEASLLELRGVSDTFAATLLLAESDGGLRPGQREPVELRALLEEVVEFYQPMATEQNVDLHLDATSDMIVSGLRAWLRQAFSNLIQNAIAHSRSRVRVRLAAPVKREVTVTIEDDGPGIPREELLRIFDRFYRSKATGQDLAGTGLGLPIAQQMTRAHGGRVEVESRESRGTTFRVTLPCGDDAESMRGPSST